jgi:small subunit ribosomal protein S12e
VKLVEALCKQRTVPILRVESGKDLGEWVGLCKIDKDGKARKVVNCSCAGITDVGIDKESYKFISDYLNKNNQA